MTEQIDPPNEPSSHDRSVAGHIYVHLVAFFGACVALVGGFAAAFVVPTMLSQTLASSRAWVTALLITGVVVGLLCAVLSYRATLRAYAVR